MSANTFTPGPWDIDAGFLVTRAHCGGVGIPILALFDPSGEAGFITGSPEECRANARLIAAAPDMIEALRGLLERHVQLVTCGDCGTWDVEEEPEVIVARAALSKALGQDGSR